MTRGAEGASAASPSRSAPVVGAVGERAGASRHGEAGIRRVVYCDEYRSEEGLDLLRKVGIECVQIDDIGA